jgi:methionyl aminopeptidase
VSAPAIAAKGDAALAGMRRAGALVAETLALLRARCLPGATTGELDALARAQIAAGGGTPAFLGVPGPTTPYPAALCASVNDEIAHGIPGPRALRDGDIVALDIGVLLDGWYGDAAITVPVGAVGARAAALIRDTEAALAAGIAAARAGNRLADITAAIQRAGRRGGYGIVREFAGHGIGRALWEEPEVPNCLAPGAGSGPVLRAGMTLTIEPIFTTGSAEFAVLADGWTARTRDGSLAAHVEHTIAIAARGPAHVLTRAG